MSQFINDKETIVTEALDGLLLTAEGRIARLNGYPHIKVIVRTDWDKSKVAIISGGGTGHEPAHAGFVGQGMLTAAICGDIFASPSVDAVLAGILSVTGDKGCLLIVKNYTGDRLNFGLAAERARACGIKVNMVIVNDDIALPNFAQPRGLAGTLFVHKITGALAEQGKDLETITTNAQKVIDGLISIGMSLGTCTVPGAIPENRISEGMSELGLGIHGEAGVEQIPYTNAKSAMSVVVERLQKYTKNQNYIALLNNLGGLTPLEMSILSKELINSPLGNNINNLIGPAIMMSSLDMHGFSVSLLPDTNEYRLLLKTPVKLMAWANCCDVSSVKILELPDGLTPVQYASSKNEEMKILILKCCDLFISAEKELNILDAKSGDGDTGSTLAGAARALSNTVDNLPLADLTQIYQAIALNLSQTMGGSSGVLLAIFFSAAGDAALNGSNNVDALKAGLERMQQVGGASLGDRTMIDALSPAILALPEGIQAAAKAAREGANYTANITKARAGRSSYVSESHLAGYNDPGAEAVALLFEKLAI